MGPEYCGYHINVESVLVEFIQDEGPVAAGEPGKVYVTSLDRKATHIIRYFTEERQLFLELLFNVIVGSNEIEFWTDAAPWFFIRLSIGDRCSVRSGSQRSSLARYRTAN